MKHLNDHILPSLKYLPNELLLGLVMNLCCTKSPEDIEQPTEQEVAIHLTLIEQQCLDGYAAMLDHAAKCKSVFDTKLQQHAPQNVVFEPKDLVQVHATQWVQMFASIKNSFRCGQYPTESQSGSLILTPWKLSMASHSQVFITQDGSGPFVPR